jgi:hypothetical protein
MKQGQQVPGGGRPCEREKRCEGNNWRLVASRLMWLPGTGKTSKGYKPQGRCFCGGRLETAGGCRGGSGVKETL